MIGYATLKEEIKDWISDEVRRASLKLCINDQEAPWEAANWSSYFYVHQKELHDYKHVVEFYNGHYVDNSKDFKEFLSIVEKESQRLNVYYHDEFATVIGFGKHKYIVPSEYVDVQYLKDYDTYSAKQITALGDDTGSMLPADMQDSSMQNLKDELEDKKKQINEVEEACKRKIEEIRQEALRKEQELRELLEKETEKLKTMKEDLENKILVLDTQIYGIRCYLGEVINFSKIRVGKPSSEETPMVVFQKIRYLDEELGKYFSLYNVTSDDKEFAEILKYRDDIRDVFCPSERSISIIKASRTGTYKAASEKVNNVLKDYEYLHANQMAILIRDGENLFMGWADEERISISSEDFFLKSGEVTIEPVKEPRGYISERDEKAIIAKERNERMSRYFLISILQGVADRGDIVKFPVGTKISEESEFIKFSYADRWLKDTRYGTFVDILDKSKDIPVKKGDTILTAMYIGRDDRGIGYNRDEYSSYNNDRGIGSRNRTHGTGIPGFKIVQINKILKEATINATINICELDGEKTNRRFTYYSEPVYKLVKAIPEKVLKTIEFEHYFTSDDYNATNKSNPSELDVVDTYCKKWGLWDLEDNDNHRYLDQSCRLSDIEEYRKNYGIADVVSAKLKESEILTYVSVESEASRWNGTNSKVNFQIYPDEYIRINYLCTTWLKYVITTGNIGNLRLSGNSRMSYADSLKYLNKLLEQVQNQENEDKKLLISAGLEDWIKNTQEWDRILVEWRIKNNVQTLGIRAAKKFAKEILKG